MTPMPLPPEAPEHLHRLVADAAGAGVFFYLDGQAVKLGAGREPPATLLRRVLAERGALFGWLMAANDVAPPWPHPGPMAPAPHRPDGPRLGHVERVLAAYAAAPGAVVRATGDGGGEIELPDGRRLHVGPDAWQRWQDR